MNQEKIEEMALNFINGNRSDVATWLDGMSGQRAAYASFWLHTMLPESEQGSYERWLEAIAS